MNRDDIKEFLEIAAGYKKSSRMLAEAEDDEDELFGDDEEDSDEGGDDEEEDKGDEKEEEEEEVKVSKDEEVELSKSLDDSLNAIFVDIESDALKSAAVQQEESLKYSLKKALLKEELSGEESIDLEKFASETARLIKNADVLLDIQSIILSKARDYLISKYEPEVEKKFLEILQSRFNIDSRTEEEKQKESDDIEVPLAIGASGGAGGG